MRVGIPLLSLVVIALYLGVRRQKIPGALVFLMLVAVLFSGAVGYPVAQFFYEKSYVQQIEKYHPYLQIRPHAPKFAGTSRDETFLIMCLGGSTTEFADEAGGWPARLEKLLPPLIGGKKVRVLNMGRQWYTTQHTLINYELNLRSIKPDVIILMQSVNDLLTNADFSYISHDTFRGDYGHFYGPVNRLIDRKGLVSFLLDLIGGLWNYSPREMVVTTNFPGLASYERNVRTILDFAKLDGTKVVLMSEPFLFKESMNADEQRAMTLLNYEAIGPTKQWSPVTTVAGMNAYNGKLSEIATSTGVSFVDLEKAIPKTLEYFYDEVHFRAGTFDLVASSVAKGVMEAGVLK
jgi:lysophospholipase L1-like esterase